jgi:hypothetical protein
MDIIPLKVDVEYVGDEEKLFIGIPGAERACVDIDLKSGRILRFSWQLPKDILFESALANSGGNSFPSFLVSKLDVDGIVMQCSFIIKRDGTWVVDE